MLKRLSALALVSTAAIVLAACGGSDSSSSVATVDIKDYTYGPGKITVAAGAKVTWTNEDSSPHTATIKDGFDTDSIAQGRHASVTLAKAGTYAYYCAFHPYMHGTIVVTG